ncbi:MAG: SDR family NAD(P)-dependent oxidoreductase [Alphaproteobacteria bacterium]|nr:SDR family NAD(P)-dependent oxidoreductase [Alphaproteobacteria bacterium]
MNKTILITGAARRIGRAMALHYAAKGWHIAAHYSDAATDAEHLRDDINAKGGKITLFQADFTKSDAAQELFSDVVKICGTPHVLINNAARFERDDGGITQKSLQAHMAVNAATPIALAQLMRTGEATENSGPRFVFNILDRSLDWSWPLLPAYVLSKLALEEWTKKNAAAYQPDLYLFGLRLGPTLRNPRESKTHFEKASAALTVTKIEDILSVMDASMESPATQPCFVNV